MSTKTEATIEDLYKVDGKAEIVNGEVVLMWDVDLLSEEVVRVYRAESRERAQVYRRGEWAEAEPAVPGWTMPVDDLFA